MPQWEQKYTVAGTIDLELEIKVDVSQRILEGYASVANNVDDGGDLIEPGAFAKTLKKRGNRLVHLWNHDKMRPFAFPEQVEDTPKGLRFLSRVANTLLGDEMLELHSKKIIKGASIGYMMFNKDYTIHDEHNRGSKGQHRTIHRISELWEYSSVTFPMNPKAGTTRVKDMHPRDAFAMWMADQELKTGDLIARSMRQKLMDVAEWLTDIANSTGDGSKSDDDPDLGLVALEAGCDDMINHIKSLSEFFAGM